MITTQQPETLAAATPAISLSKKHKQRVLNCSQKCSDAQQKAKQQQPQAEQANQGLDEDEPREASSWQFERKYTLSEVQQHSTFDDCWMVIFDKVYDITSFVDEHPGGDYILLEYAGRDATHPFLSSRHGSSAYKLLDKYWIGILVDEELYYSNNSSYCSVYSNLSWRHRAQPARRGAHEPTLDSRSTATLLSAAAADLKVAASESDSTAISSDEEGEEASRVESDDSGIEVSPAQAAGQSRVGGGQRRQDGASEADSANDSGNSDNLEQQQQVASKLQTTCPSLAQLWSKATQTVLSRATTTTTSTTITSGARKTTESEPAAAPTTASRLQSCLKQLAFASGWFLL